MLSVQIGQVQVLSAIMESHFHFPNCVGPKYLPPEGEHLLNMIFDESFYEILFQIFKNVSNTS